jgi:hypothetical protein
MTINLRTVSRVLDSIETQPGLRAEHRPGDLDGHFDQWFDGGAVKFVTGWNEYHFVDGTFALIPTTPTLHVEIRLPSGSYVIVSEQRQAPPNIALLSR